MTNNINQQNKQIVWNFWKILDETPTDKIQNIVHSTMATDVIWYGFAPLNHLEGMAAFCQDFWQPLKQAFPDLKRESHIFMGGKSNGRVDGNIDLDGKMWVSGTGYFHATFTHDYLGIPAAGEKVRIRWGEFCRIENSKIVEIYFQIDLIDLMQQVGIQVLPPSKGKDHIYPPPHAQDGVLLIAPDQTVSDYSLDHIRRFIFDGLNSYDQTELKSMGMADFFKSDVQWYGPGGIGACLSLKEFEDLHQQPWLIAFPDRQVQDLDALIAEGNYSGAPGWAGVKATHTGPYLACPPTGNSIVINGLDWWKREGEMYIENWVFVDMIHLFQQFGVDLLAKLASR